MIWATVSSRSCFCWLYRASSSMVAKNIISLILVLTIWWYPCIESSLVLLEESVCYHQCVLLEKLLVFALLHSILQGQICLTEAEDIKKRWQEYTEKLYKKDLHNPDNHNGVITHLEPHILECEVKWALESITTNKASRDDGIPVELFQILKDDAVQVLHSICLQIWKTQQWPRDWKRSIFISISKKGNAKEYSNYCTIALISHASKVMLKILQVRLQQYMNREIPDVQAGFRKGRGTRDQIANIRWIIEKAREFQKKHLLLYWLHQSLWLGGSQQTVENS